MIELSFLLLAASAAAQEAQPQEQTPRPPGTIVVTGEREEEGHVEEPYPEQEQQRLGSRIRRRDDRRPFSTIATNTGLGGMIPGPGVDFDATGASVPRFRNRVVRECVAGHERVSEATACVLFRVRQHIERGEHSLAAAALDPLLGRRTLSGIDRFYGASFSYQLAQVMDDDVRRESALTTMLASEHMPAADRAGAMRTLARLAAERGDTAAAIARFEQLVADVPGDPRNHADLAWIYARNGRDRDALPRMETAVRLARQAGAEVPQTWLDFINGDP